MRWAQQAALSAALSAALAVALYFPTREFDFSYDDKVRCGVRRSPNPLARPTHVAAGAGGGEAEPGRGRHA